MRASVLAAQLGFVLAVIAFWELGARGGLLSPDVLPAFSDVMVTLVEFLRSETFQNNAWDTLVRIAVAFVLGAPPAIALGFYIGEKVHFGKVLEPLIHFSIAIPQSIFLPLFIFAFGIGFAEKVIFGITHIVFVLALNTIAAVRSVPRSYVTAARSFGATPAQIYWKIFIPAMLPLVITGLRMAMIFNIIGILLAEMYASQTGMGMLIFHWGESHDVKKLMAAIVLVSLVTIAINEAMRIWEYRSGRWLRRAGRS
jgi:ABC-type nitrate/sulfonate/bicarbonate transport system permease component